VFEFVHIFVFRLAENNNNNKKILNKNELLEAILAADAAGYAFVVEESSCLRHNVEPIDTFLSVRQLRTPLNSPSISAAERGKILLKEAYQTQMDESAVADAPGGAKAARTDSSRYDPSNADASIRPPILNSMVESEVVRFVDENPGAFVDYTALPDEDQYADIQPSTDLADYLSRPVLIDTQTYNMSTSVGFLGQINPWRLYFSNTAIKNKLQNYAYLSCKLHIKTIVNCSQFYYGNCLYGYVPAHGYISGPDTSTNLGAIQVSQLPHYWIYPQKCQGGELVLPFFWHKTYMDITTASLDPTNIGKLVKWAMTPLRSANGAASGNATLQTYAWATDVRLHAPTIRAAMQSYETQMDGDDNTSRKSSISRGSRKSSKVAIGGDDEYGDRVLSKSASAISTALGEIGDAPLIGKYATASSMVAGAIGKIAHLFGYTNPPNMNNVEFFKPTPAPHFASSDVSVPFDKFALDPKTELSIDPSLVGLDSTDELNLSYLCQKETFLCDFDWAIADTVDQVNFAAQVSPNMFNLNDGSNPKPIYDTVISYMSRMFQFWRGDLIFRFRFICSPFHKGRIRLTYDPRGDIGNNVPDYAVVFNEIVDIGTVQDVEIRVPYMQTMAWLGTESSNYSASALKWATNGTATPIGNMVYVNGKNNGVITWRVVTPLTAPSVNADIKVQVFVRGAENFELAVPRTLDDYTPYVTQSDESSASTLGAYDNPMLILAGNALAKAPKSRYLNNIGENIVSLRKLLRRTVYHSSVNYADASDSGFNWTLFSTFHNRIPFLHGFDDNNGTSRSKGVISTGNTYYANFVKNSVFTWLYPCFAGLRGGFNWHHVVNSMTFLDAPKVDPICSISSARYNFPITRGVQREIVSWDANNSSSSNAAYYRARIGTEANSASGMALQSKKVNNTVSFVAPNYNMYRLNYCSLGNSSGSKSTFGGNIDTGTLLDNVVTTIMVPSASANKPIYTYIDKYFSVGTDFNFHFFVCVPVIYNCPIIDMNPQ
jgi:hypothetical protein